MHASHVHGFSSRWLAAAAAAIAMIGNAEFSSNWTISSWNKITNFIRHWNSTWRAYISLVRKQAIQRGGIGGEAARGRKLSHSQFLTVCVMLETICFHWPTRMTTKQDVVHCTSQVCQWKWRHYILHAFVHIVFSARNITIHISLWHAPHVRMVQVQAW